MGYTPTGSLNTPDRTYFEGDGTLVAAGEATTFMDIIGDISSLKTAGAGGITAEYDPGSLRFSTTVTYNANPALASFVWINFQINHQWRLYM